MATKAKRGEMLKKLVAMQPPVQPEVLEREARSAVGFASRFEAHAARLDKIIQGGNEVPFDEAAWKLIEADAPRLAPAFDYMEVERDHATYAAQSLRRWARDLLKEARVKREERGH